MQRLLTSFQAKMFRLVILVCLVSTSWSYDFKDSFYNDYLLEKFYIYQTRNTNLLKLGTPFGDGSCKRPLKYHCCDNLNTELTLQLEVSKNECYVAHVLSTSEGVIDTKKAVGPLDVFSCEKLKKLQEEYVCVSQCVARKWNMTDESGNLFSAEMLAFVKKFYAEQVYEDAQMEKFVQECLEYTEKYASATTELQCNPATSSFGYCMWRKTILECPEARWDTSAACEQLREQLAE